MPFSLGHFITGANLAASGALRGDTERRERERQQQIEDDKLAAEERDRMLRWEDAMRERGRQREIDARNKAAQDMQMRVAQAGLDANLAEEDRAETERIRGEALMNEGASMYASKYPDALGTIFGEALQRGGAAPELVVQQGKLLEAREQEGPDYVERQRQFGREDSLVSDYQTWLDKQLDAYKFVDSAIKTGDLAISGDGPAQIQLLYAYVKAMDPTSVVREGEISLARLGANMRQKAQAILAQVESGGQISALLPPAMVPRMLELMQKMQAEKEASMRERYDSTVYRAKTWGVNPDVFPAPPQAYSQQRQAGGAGGAVPSAFNGAIATPALDALLNPSRATTPQRPGGLLYRER